MCEEERKQRRLSEDKTGRIKKFPDLGSWVAELYSLFLTLTGKTIKLLRSGGGGEMRCRSLRPVGQMGRRLLAPTVDVFGQREMD